MVSATNEQTIRHLAAEINRGNVDVIDEVFAEDYVAHPLVYRPIAPPGVETVSGRDLVKAVQRMNQEWFQGTVTIEKLIDAGEYVTLISGMEGTTKDGKPITGHGIWVYRMAGGKVVESWFIGDRLGAFQQLGIVPETAELQRQAGMRP